MLNLPHHKWIGSTGAVKSHWLKIEDPTVLAGSSVTMVWELSPSPTRILRGRIRDGSASGVWDGTRA